MLLLLAVVESAPLLLLLLLQCFWRKTAEKLLSEKPATAKLRVPTQM